MATENPIQPHELPKFDDSGGWYATTRKGLVTKMFESDADQMNPALYDEAVDVIEYVITTGMPPFGGWR